MHDNYIYIALIDDDNTVADSALSTDTSLEVSDDPTDSANLLSTSTDELAASLPSKDLPASNSKELQVRLLHA